MPPVEQENPEQVSKATHRSSGDFENAPVRPTDSPWFWCLCFASAGLVFVTLIGPKYEARQASLKEKYLARQVTLPTNRSKAGVATRQETLQKKRIFQLPNRSTKPFLFVLTFGILIGWVMYWFHRLQVRKNSMRARNSFRNIDD